MDKNVQENAAQHGVQNLFLCS